jgi:hypothetical protein
MRRTDEPDFEARAARRRATWSGGKAASFDELEQTGLAYWAGATAGQKFQAMWDALVEAWIIEGKHGPPPRFQGSIVGVGRFER